MVIPVYNSEEHIRECLDHIIHQSYSDIEIICVDDGSSDSSREIIRKEYPSAVLIEQKNSGAGIARNTCFSRCTGEYVLFMDSDDWAEYDLFRKVYEVIRKTGDHDMIMYSHSRFDQASALEDIHYVSRDLDGIFVSNLEKDPSFFLNNDFVVPWNKVVRSQFIRDHGLRYPDFKCSNDRPFYLASLIHAESVAVINDVLINYRVNSKSVTSESRLDHFVCHFLTYQLVEDDYSKKPGNINEIFTDLTVRDMFHFYDVSNKKYRNIIGRQICEYSDSMNLDSIPDAEKYWWYRKIVNLKLEYGIPVPEPVLKAVASAGDKTVQRILGEKLLPSFPEYAVSLLMYSADSGDQKAKEILGDVSFELCSSLAEAGHPGAQFRLAKMYRDGKGVGKNPELAFKWMKTSADQGHKGAKMNLLDLLPPEEAFPVCFEIAESGNRDAQFRLAKMYRDGKGVGKNPELAFKWMKTSADQGHPGAKESIISFLPPEKALDAYRELAENGNRNAQFNLGMMLLDSNPDEAWEWINLAAEHGHPKANDLIKKKTGNNKKSRVSELISENTVESLKEAVSISSDKKTLSRVKYRLALKYRDADGIPRDMNEARKWMSEAAENGHSEAVKCISKRGLGIDARKLVRNAMESSTPEETEKLCRELSDDGFPDALGQLGKAYLSGNDVDEDTAKALELMKEAYLSGWDSEDVLKAMWIEGSYDEMVSIAEKMASGGNGNAMNYLGRAYRDGKGVSKDLIKSAEWMRKSADAGTPWAESELLEVLWAIGDESSINEMISVARKLSETGDPRAAGTL